jgi:hypothetical protein
MQHVTPQIIMWTLTKTSSEVYLYFVEFIFLTSIHITQYLRSQQWSRTPEKMNPAYADFLSREKYIEITAMEVNNYHRQQ